MRKIWVTLAGLALFAFPAFSQQINGNITTSGTTCATATNCVILPLQNSAGSATITVSGTFSGTLQFEVSGDNTNFVATNAFPSNSTTAVTSTTAVGTWTVNVGSKVVIRVRASALASGTATVNINATPASANSISGGGGGGGGSGTVTEVDTSGPITGGPITTTGTIGCATCGVTGSPLSQFAATTSAQLAGVLSDETGTGVAVFSISPALTGTPTVPTATVGTNTTQAASTAFVLANAGGSGNTTSTSLTTNALPKANGANSIINSSVSDNGTTVSTAEPLSVGASVSTTADGTHPSSVSLVGNTTLPTLVTNTVTLLGPPSATPTAWSLQVPTALPTTTDLFSCVVTGTNCLLTDSGIPSANVVTLAGSQTLTNKILTSPTMTAPVLGTPASGNGSNLTALNASNINAGNIPAVNGPTNQGALLAAQYTNATTGGTSLTGISFTVAANTKYRIQCSGRYQASASTAGIKIQWTGPASPTLVDLQMLVDSAVGTTAGSSGTAFSSLIGSGAATTTGADLPFFTFLTVSNGANSGTVQLQAAAGGAGTLTIQAGFSCTNTLLQ